MTLGRSPKNNTKATPKVKYTPEQKKKLDEMRQEMVKALNSSARS